MKMQELDTDTIPEKNKNKNKKKSDTFFKNLVGIFIGVCIIGGAFFAYFNRTNPIVNHFVTQLMNGIPAKTASTSIPLDSGTAYECGMYKNSIILCDKEGIKAISKKGQDEWNISLAVNNPIMQIGTKYILVADKGGKEADIIANNTITCSIKTEEAIITAKMNESGYFAVATAEKGYKGQVIVYDPKGQECFRWHSGEGYIVDITLSPDDKRMAVATIDTGKGKVSGGVVFFNLKQDKPYAGVVKDDTIFTNIKFYKDNDLVAVGDNQTIAFSSEGQQLWAVTDYKGENLFNFNIDSEDMIVLALSDKSKGGILGSNSQIRVIGRNGKDKISPAQIAGEVKFMSVRENLIAVNGKNGVSIISAGNGKEVANAPSSRDIKDVILLDNKDEILTISRSALDILELKK